jgi:FAD/FMN-containing dehydrogenase
MSVSTAIHAGDGAPAALLERLASILPRNALLVGDAIDPRYQEDRRGRYSARPRFIARPGTTEEVAACLAACNDFAQPLVVQGGRTGLSGGHRIADGEAVLVDRAHEPARRGSAAHAGQTIRRGRIHP